LRSDTIARRIPLAAALAATVCVLFCSYERNNPVDPNGKNYVGDRYATDATPPQLFVANPAADTTTIYSDSVVVIASAYDEGSGVKLLTVNNAPADSDSSALHGSYVFTYWHLTVFLASDTTKLTIAAVDSAYRRNTTT